MPVARKAADGLDGFSTTMDPFPIDTWGGARPELPVRHAQTDLACWALEDARKDEDGRSTALPREP